MQLQNPKIFLAWPACAFHVLAQNPAQRRKSRVPCVFGGADVVNGSPAQNPSEGGSASILGQRGASDGHPRPSSAGAQRAAVTLPLPTRPWPRPGSLAQESLPCVTTSFQVSGNPPPRGPQHDAVTSPTPARCDAVLRPGQDARRDSARPGEPPGESVRRWSWVRAIAQRLDMSPAKSVRRHAPRLGQSRQRRRSRSWRRSVR
jgi:hypothetical protein